MYLKKCYIYISPTLLGTEYMFISNKLTIIYEVTSFENKTQTNKSAAP